MFDQYVDIFYLTTGAMIILSLSYEVCQKCLFKLFLYAITKFFQFGTTLDTHFRIV
jgi:hypothetical protein